MKIKKIYILFLAVTFIFYLFIDFNFLNNSRPIPTEFINKKNKRNQLKKDRKAWIENMHKSHPDDNWREIDRINRKKIQIIIYQLDQILLIARKKMF